VTLLAAEAAPPGAPEQPAELGLARVLEAPAKLWSRAAGAGGALIAGLPLQCGIFDTASLRQAISSLVAAEPFDLVHVQLARLALCVDHALPRHLPRVVDLVDALSVNMTRRAERDRGPLALLAREESKRLARYERALVARWQHATVCTESDRAAIGAHPRLSVNANGVDGSRLAFSRAPRLPGRVIFSGNLGYFPNIEALEWLASEIWPRVRARLPWAELVAVGARPHRRLARLARVTAGVELVGPVEDLRAELVRAMVSVAPIRAGSGQPLKVLEALAVGTPVVATPSAAAGLEVISGEHLLLAADAGAFAEAIVRLLERPDLRDRVAAAGRELIERSHGWDEPVEALDEIWMRASVNG